MSEVLSKERKTILDVQNLKMYFSSGTGKKAMQVKAVDDVSFKIYEGEGHPGSAGAAAGNTSRAGYRRFK